MGIAEQRCVPVIRTADIVSVIHMVHPFHPAFRMNEQFTRIIHDSVDATVTVNRKIVFQAVPPVVQMGIIGYRSFTNALLDMYEEGAFLTAESAAELVDV